MNLHDRRVILVEVKTPGHMAWHVNLCKWRASLRFCQDRGYGWLELLRRVNEIPGVSYAREKITKRPNISLRLLAADPAALDQLKRVLEWVEQRAQAGWECGNPLETARLSVGRES
jgi:hypothetical protein